MRFFTLDWWQGETNEDAGALYMAHLEKIRAQLTPSLVDVINPPTPDQGLHDTRLRDLSLDVGAQSLVLQLDSWDATVALTMTYLGVSHFSSTGDPKRGQRGPHGFGDLGYHEIDLAAGGGFEHRILFSTGIEVRVQFADARILRQRVVVP